MLNLNYSQPLNRAPKSEVTVDGTNQHWKVVKFSTKKGALPLRASRWLLGLSRYTNFALFEQRVQTPNVAEYFVDFRLEWAMAA